jgi:hypothetical protein
MVKLAENPGHATTFTRGNANIGRPAKPILPSKEEVAILRRASQGFIKATMIDGSPSYSYEDGSKITFRSDEQHKIQRQFSRMVENRWLLPDQKDSLFEGGTPQVYRARRP